MIMRDFRIKKRYLPLLVVLLVVLAFGGALFIRSPVLIVTDASFSLLYGAERFRNKSFMTSLELCRRVIPVNVNESAVPNLVALAVDSVSRRPKAVLFPYRYIEGAKVYRESHPEVPVLVMGGRNTPTPGDTGLVFIGTDFALDLYRAGLCAAFFARDNKRILFITDGTLMDEYR